MVLYALTTSPAGAYLFTPQGGGGPPGPYATGAVAFDGSTYLVNPALACVDGQVLSASYWVFRPDPSGDGIVWVSDPVNNYSSLGETWSNNVPPSHKGVVGSADFTGIAFGLANETLGVWEHVLFSGTIGSAVKLYINGVDLTRNGQILAGDNYVMNGLPFWVGADSFGANFSGYMADLWIAPGQSLLSGGDIPPATLAKFISGGKPVDLGADGSTPTGIAPAVFLRRAPAAAASTFANNLGTGLFFGETGALTAAPSSPSD